MEVGENDKPFCCTSFGCNMRFTNEDHLTVHMKKHEMSLSLNQDERASGQVNSINNNFNNNSMLLFVDQTPTPTRFIRNCEEVGLFQDLQSVNPFEDHFRKAVESAKSGNNPSSAVELLRRHNDILHTPSITASDLEAVSIRLVDTNDVNDSVNDDDVLDTSMSDVVDTEGTLILCKAEQGDEQLILNNENMDQVIVVTSSTTPTKALTFDAASNSYNANDEDVSILSTTESSNLGTDVIYTFTSSSNTIMATTSASVVTTNTITDTNTTSTNNITDNNTTTTTDDPTQAISLMDVGNVQFILRLPDGMYLPVSLPQTNLGSAADKSVPTSTSTKQTLKRTLMAARSGISKSATKLPKKISSDCLTFDSTSNDSDSRDRQLTERSGHDDLEHPEEKRKKFLERNRAAATRCRQKRKQFVQTLESKADQLNTINQQLQSEVTSLRNEVAQLKSMLLAHKDCPVTQQQKLGQINGITSRVGSSIVRQNGNNVEVMQMNAAEAIASSALTNLAQSVHVLDETTIASATTATTTIPVIVNVGALQSSIIDKDDDSSIKMTKTIQAQSVDGHIIITLEDER